MDIIYQCVRYIYVKDGHGALDHRFPILYLHMTRQDPVTITQVLPHI